MLKKAVVDIDNTLWQFCDVLYGGLKEINSLMPPPDQWIEWDFWMNYCSEDEFMSVIRRIQLNQDDDRHVPYSEAKNFLETLKKYNYHIIIASHRTPESLHQTRSWLNRHCLIHDELHLSYDKSVLFDEECHIVIDDAPSVLSKAIERGIAAMGLRFAWNRDQGNNGYQLFSDLNEVSHYIRNI